MIRIAYELYRNPRPCRERPPLCDCGDVLRTSSLRFHQATFQDVLLAELSPESQSWLTGR